MTASELLEQMTLLEKLLVEQQLQCAHPAQFVNGRKYKGALDSYDVPAYRFWANWTEYRCSLCKKSWAEENR